MSSKQNIFARYSFILFYKLETTGLKLRVLINIKLNINIFINTCITRLL